MHSGSLAGGLQAANWVIRLLSEGPDHLPASVTYLQHVSNRLNNMQHLQLSVMQRIQSGHHIFAFVRADLYKRSD